MNQLIIKLNNELKKNNLGCIVKKETITLIHCYLYDLKDFKPLGKTQDFRECLKLDVTYKKQDLYTMINNKSLREFCERERSNYETAKKLNLLRK